MAIKVYNVTKEEYFDENTYLIHRPHILSNPYTHIKDKQTKALWITPTREDAIQKYSHYFDVMYGNDIKFTNIIDEIYEKYKKGEEIKLGCYCAPNTCHGDIIAQKIKSRYIKEQTNKLLEKVEKK